MSNYLGIATVTSALKQLILLGLQNATWNFTYDLAVTTTPLDVARPQALDAMGQINLFLYHTGLNAGWRNEPLPRQVKKGETGSPSLALDLRYLITAYAPDNDGVESHRILGCTLAVLHDHALLGAAELAAALENSDVHEQVERVRLTPLTVSVEEMSQLWNMFQKPYNLSVAWQASVLLIESKRATRAPLPVLTRSSAGAADKGTLLQPQLGPFTPGIESIAPPLQQVSAHLGETLEVRGHLLAGDLVRVAVAHSRWTITKDLVPAAISARAVSVALPSGSAAETEWPAGLYMLSLGVTPTLGNPELLTNELSFALAPTVVSIDPVSGSPDVTGNYALTVEVTPEVWPQQRVTLIVGDRTFAPETFAGQTGTLQFSLGGLAPGKYRVRLRVDGVDSLVIDKTTTPPTFTGPELEVL